MLKAAKLNEAGKQMHSKEYDPYRSLKTISLEWGTLLFAAIDAIFILPVYL